MSIQHAISELTSIIDSQWVNGMIPHIRFVKGEVGYSPDANEWECLHKTIKDKFETSGITQPPVIGIALYKIIQNIQNIKNYKNELIYIIKGIEQFHDFLFRERDPNKENIICIIHPWESGLDNSPVFDEDNEYAKIHLNKLNIKQQIKDRKDINKVIAAFRPGEKDYEVYGKLIGFFKQKNYNQKELAINSPFRVQDSLFNTLLYKAMDCMIKSYILLSDKIDYDFNALIKKNQKKLNLLKNALNNKLLDTNSNNYYSYSLNLNKKIKIDTIQTLITNIYFSTNKIDIENSIEKYTSSSTLSFLSTKSTSNFFNPIKYWRGPIWPITNWIIIEHLKTIDNKMAINYSYKTLKLISENFDLNETHKHAMDLMHFNLVLNEFTTPSKNQYKHGWFWDSAFASIGWINVNKKNLDNNIYEDIYIYKNSLVSQEENFYKIRKILKKKYKMALFDEYYIGVNTKQYEIGEPIGSEMMTWTASVYIDLYNFIKNSTTCHCIPYTPKFIKSYFFSNPEVLQKAKKLKFTYFQLQ